MKVRQTIEWYIPDCDDDMAWNLIMSQFKDYMIGAPKMVTTDMEYDRA